MTLLKKAGTDTMGITLLDKAIEKVRRLPEGEQEAIAQIMLEELADEEEWQRKFAATADKLDRLAEMAVEADRNGKSTPLTFPHDK